jgi:hypothetical protein
MSDERSIGRRAFVVGGLGLVAAGAGAVAVQRGRLDDTVDPSVIAHRADGLAALGTAYLATYPGDLDLDGLFDAVPPLAGATSRGDVRAALPAVAEAARRDFAEGRVVVVDNWRLARTEARAAALLAGFPA